MTFTALYLWAFQKNLDFQILIIFIYEMSLLFILLQNLANEV